MNHPLGRTGPGWRRGIVILCHWATFLMALAMVKGGAFGDTFRWVFVGTGGLWLAVMALGGPLGRPGPALKGLFRAFFRPFHLALYGAVAAAVGLNAAALTGRVGDGAAKAAVLTLFFAGLIHAVFHMWRHTALRDGALRRITPRILHRHL